MGAPARHVVGARRQPGERGDVGAGHVLDVDEITELIPILEQLRCLIVRESQREDPQRAVVGVLEGLRPSLDGAVAQDDPLDPMPLSEETDQLLLRQLAQAVGAGRSGHGLVGDHRRDRTAADWAGRVPDATLEGIDPPWLRIDIAVLAAAIFALAVDRHRRPEHHPPHRCLPFEEQLEENRRADRIDVEEFAEGRQIVVVIREVQHDLVLLERLDPVLPLANISLDELHTRRKRRWAVVRRRGEVVEDGDLVPLLHQMLAGALTNEAGPAGDQHLHCWGL